MPTEIYVPYTGAAVIEVDGMCYEFVELVAMPPTNTVVYGVYNTCEECAGDSDSDSGSL